MIFVCLYHQLLTLLAHSSNILFQLLHTIAPVLPHLADEVHLHRNDVDSKTSIMKQRWSVSSGFLTDPEIQKAAHLRRAFQDCLLIRKYLFTHTQLSSHDLKELDLKMEISGNDETMSQSYLIDVRDILAELLGCASLTLEPVPESHEAPSDWTLSPLPSIKRLVEKPAWAVTEDDADEPAVAEEMEILTPHLSDGAEFRFQTEKTIKHSCLRCRLFRAGSEGALCTRCSRIVNR